MATGSSNMTTYKASQVIGNDSAQNPAGALLQSGAGRADDSTTGDTWIFLDTYSGTASPWGIKHSQGDDKIKIIGNSTDGFWVTMNTGDTYILGKVGIGYDPETSGNTYKLYVNGLSYFNNSAYFYDKIGIGYDPETQGNTDKLYVNGTSNFADTIFFHNDGSLQIFTQTNGQNYAGSNTENVCIQTSFDNQDYTYEHFASNLNRVNLLLQPKGGQVYIGSDLTGLGDTNYKLYVNGNSYYNGNTTHNGIDYFANGTTYYINNNADARLRYAYTNACIGYDAASFISSSAGSAWPYIRFDTRDGGTAYVTTAQTNWCELYAQVPAKRASDNAYYKTRFFFRQYSKTANTTTRLGYYEDYYLPETNDDRTGNAGYDIRTSKSSAYNVDTATHLSSAPNNTTTFYRGDKTWSDTLTGPFKSTYRSGTWVNSLTNSAITLTDDTNSYGGWICGPTKAGRIAISTYSASDNYIYLGYGERGRTTNSFATSIKWDGPNNVLYTNRVDMAWLRVVNDSSNNSDDATVYIQCQTANDWALKIVKGGKDYGLRVDSLDQGNAIWTNGYINCRILRANQGSNGERQVIVDSGTSGNLYMFANTTEKGIYASSGYHTGYIIKINSSARYIYGHETWGGKVVITSNWIGFYSANFSGTRYGYIQTDANRMYFRKENGANNNIGFDFGDDIYCSSEYISGTSNGLRIKNVMLRNDGSNFYFLVGTSNTPGDNWNSLRPFYWNLSNGYCYHTRAYNAVWNDYAEFRKGDTIEPGYCVVETSSGVMTKSTSRLQPGAKMISDTYGEAMGETKEAKTPIAVSGRMLAYTYRNRDEYPLGAAVCSAPGGTIDVMTREEIMMYPERIVGTVSEIPDYDIWNSGGSVELGPSEEIQVNGRIWIYVK